MFKRITPQTIADWGERIYIRFLELTKRFTSTQIMALLAIIVGVLAGLGTCLFELLLYGIKAGLTHWFPVEQSHFLFLFYPVIGIILASLFVKYVVKDNISEGVTRVLYAMSRKNSYIASHNCWTSVVGGATTIGFGGSVGPEAPIVLTGAAIGSNISRLAHLNYKNTTLLLCCGAGAALAAIFKAPITGVVFVLEILMLDLTSRTVVPLLISSITAAAVALTIRGFDPIIAISLTPDDAFRLNQIPLFVLLGELRRDGISGVREHARARREYAALFPGRVMRADRFASVELLVHQAEDQPAGPKISIVVPLYNTPLDFLDEMLDSVVNQTYKNWELCCVDAGKDEAVGQHVQARAKADARIRYQKLEKNELIPGNTNKGFEMATGEYIALLDHDDLLHPCALWYAARAIAEQKADFVYTDEATFEGKVENVVLYHFKPDFMLDNLRSNNYICHLTVFSRALMERAGGGERMEYNGSQDYELFLRLTEQAEKIVHIPHALYYWRSSPGSTAADISAKTYCIDAGIAALKAHYARCGIAVDDVALIPGTPGYYKTDYTIEHPGRVSILIPTCDHIRDLELCVDSIYARTTYPDFELILIENNSKQPETFRAYERMQKEHPDNLKVVTWEGKGFNYSALNNFGEKFATGEYLLLLNNDTEVITAAWLEEMVMYAQQKRVGCVGAKLLYPDDTIQHAGVGFGIGGVAGHLHKYYPASSDGYMGRLNYVQDVYADTAACLLIRKEIYDEVGGLDESYAVAFNDVDFCVRVRQAGYTNVFTPFAQLYHYESKSRGVEDNPEKQKRFQGEVLRFQARWGDLLAAGDPCTNPNFDIQREDFSLKILPLE